MNQQHITDALNTLAKMAELEIAVARFYEACGQRWVEEGDIWLNLAEMEIQHAKNIKQIADAVRGRPEKFKAVRFVNISSIDNVISRLNIYAEQVISGPFLRKRLFALPVIRKVLSSSCSLREYLKRKMLCIRTSSQK